MNFQSVLKQAGVALGTQTAGGIEAHTPIDGSVLTWVNVDSAEAIEA